MATCQKCQTTVTDPYDAEGAGIIDGIPSVKALWECPICGNEWKTVSPISQDTDEGKAYARMQWNDFLNNTFVNTEIIDFIQLAVGFIFTGRNFCDLKAGQKRNNGHA